MMTFSEFSHVRLKAVAAVVPRDEVRLEDEAAYYGNDLRKVERIKKMAGLDRRRIAPEGVTVSDLCVQAAERLLAETATDRAGIDAIVCVTQSGDYPVPASAAFLLSTAARWITGQNWLAYGGFSATEGSGADDRLCGRTV
jgi:3-oxoacyl-[acyl-carrier-protein] synthase-3